jgi:hypothetical protein
MNGSALAESYANVGVGRGRWKAPMTKRAKPRPATTSSWNIYLAHHSPAKWIGTVEAVDADAAIAEAAKLSM